MIDPETDWAETRARVSEGFIRDFLGRLADSLRSTSERDKYRTRLDQVSTRLTLFDRRGRELRVLTPAGGHRRPRFSPDGQRIVAEKVDAQKNTDLWIYDVLRESASRLTSTEAR